MDENSTQSSVKNSESTNKKFVRPEVLFEWSGPAHVHNHREESFFVTLFIVAVGVAFVLVLFKQYMLMLVVFALAFAIYAANKHEPQTVRYQVLTNAVKINDDQYNYSDLANFWFETVGGKTVLKISTNLRVPAYLEFVLQDQEREDLEEVFLEHIPYQEEKDHRMISFIKKMVLPIHEPMAPLNASPVVDTTTPTAPASPTDQQTGQT